MLLLFLSPFLRALSFFLFSGLSSLLVASFSLRHFPTLQIPWVGLLVDPGRRNHRIKLKLDQSLNKNNHSNTGPTGFQRTTLSTRPLLHGNAILEENFRCSRVFVQMSFLIRTFNKYYNFNQFIRVHIHFFQSLDILFTFSSNFCIYQVNSFSRLCTWNELLKNTNHNFPYRRNTWVKFKNQKEESTSYFVRIWIKIVAPMFCLVLDRGREWTSAFHTLWLRNT